MLGHCLLILFINLILCEFLAVNLDPLYTGHISHVPGHIRPGLQQILCRCRMCSCKFSCYRGNIRAHLWLGKNNDYSVGVFPSFSTLSMATHLCGSYPYMLRINTGTPLLGSSICSDSAPYQEKNARYYQVYVFLESEHFTLVLLLAL